MKKLLLTLAAALIGASAMMAETATFPENTTTGWAAYTWTQTGDDFTGTVGNFTFVLAKNTSGNNLVSPDAASIRVYAGANLTITAPDGYVMTEVSGLTAASNKALGTSVSEGWTNETGTITAAANQAIKFTAQSPQASITFDGNGKQLRVKSLTITYQLSSTSTKAAANLKFPQTSYTANLGEAFTAPTPTKDTDAAITYTSSKPEVATVDATTGAITLVAEGTTTITAETAETDKFYAGKASYTLEVVDPNKPGATIGNPMTVAHALEACADAPKGVYVKGIVTKVTTVYSSQYKNVTFNIADEAGSTDVLEAYRSEWGADVTPTADNNPQVGATVILYGDLKIYNGKKELDAKNKIVSYTAPALPSAGLKFPETTYTINIGETFTAPELTKATEAAATYTSSNPAVAEVDAATGAVTVKAYGSTVITATTAETATYLAGEASYTLVILNPSITAENPLSVAEALAVCENEPHNVYVKGIVTEVTTKYDSQYKNVSFNIADEAGGTEVLLAYRTKWGEGVTATADNNPEVGATVVIYGDLKIHNNIKEFNANNMIVKYNIPTGIEDIEIEANAPVEYFNLQGVRVANPENGLYIRRQGNKVSKVIVK